MATNSRIEPIERATQRTWADWLEFMNRIGAKDLTHHEIATELLDELNCKIDNIGWWAQAVTVAYEQYIGRRVPGQRPDGTFQTSVSKSTELGMKELMDAWVHFASQDHDLLALVRDEVRVSGTENRTTWRTKANDDSSVVVISEPKKNGGATLVAQQMGLQSNELNLEAKARWSSMLTRFLESL